MGPDTRARLRTFIYCAALAGLYFLAARWGLKLAFVQANATAVWPPTGIAMAALLIGGYKFWPGIFGGAFLANLFTAGTALTSLGIAAGNTLEALSGFYLVTRLAGGPSALREFANLFKFTLLGGLVAPLISATIGVLTLALAGMTGDSSLKDVWVTWWLGDVGGALLVAPPILLWPRRFPESPKLLFVFEGAALAVLSFFVSWLLFSGQTIVSTGNYPVQFLFIPLLLWAATRFGPFISSLAVLILSILSIQGTLHGLGPFHGATQNESLLFLQSFMSVTAVTILALAVGSEELRRSHSNLQLKVLERTRELMGANEKLEREIREKETIAAELQDSNAKFHLLSETTQEGVVIAAEGKFIGANSIFCRMFGYELNEIIGKKAEDFVAPECRETVRRKINEGYEKTYGVTGLRKDGTRIDLEITGKNRRLEGEAVRVTALRDVTHRNRLDEERRRLALLVETSFDFICLAAVDGHMLYVNTEGRRLVGLGLEEDVAPKLHRDFVAPEDEPRLMNDVIASLLSAGHWEGEFQLRHFGTGERLPFHFTAVLIKDPVTGEPQAMAGIGRDLRELQKKDEELRRMALLLENIQDYAIYFLDLGGRIVSWNAGAQRVKGYEAGEVIGQSLALFFTQEDRASGKPEKLLRQAANRGRAEDEGWLVRKDGSRFWADTILTALRDRNGELQGFAKITRDVTQRKHLEELTRSNKELEQFAYVASHDLQEPLRMVTSFVQLLARKYQGKLDADADVYIAQTVEGASRMRSLILDLLAYSRVESAKKPLERMDCATAFDHALLNLGATLRENQADVSCGPLPSIKGDFDQVVQLFQNLIANSVKFKGTSPPRIRVEAYERGGEWVFCVRDNGIGIDPKYSAQIFEIFKRLHTHSEYPGTGIGLAICKKVVTRHGGRIWVESKPGEGSVFYWTFPAVQEAPLEPEFVS